MVHGCSPQEVPKELLLCLATNVSQQTRSFFGELCSRLALLKYML